MNSETKKSRRTTHPNALKEALRIVVMGDTHELHQSVDTPDGDLLIHVGDFTMFSRSQSALADFDHWLGELPHRWRLVVPGNHERFFEAASDPRRLLANAKVLINEAVEIEGLPIWGSPVTPGFGPAFVMANPADRRRLYAQIPDDTDILVTHGPPLGILDQPPSSGVHIGDPVLLDAVRRVRPMLHVFGHVHGAYGVVQTEDTLFANAALLGSGGGIEHQPIVLRLPQKSAMRRSESSSPKERS